MQLVIPAYNEAGRLPATLAALNAYVAARTSWLQRPVEVLVVDNDSTDATAEVALGLSTAAVPVRVLSCPIRGKGAAVRAGILASDADIVGFLDADGATDLDALDTAIDRLEMGADIAIASRALSASCTEERHSRLRQRGASAYRNQTRRIAPGISDTQCGFKVMRGDLARRLAARQRSFGFSFDVELLGRAQRWGAAIVEFPVVWRDMPGSTFKPLRHGASAFWELAVIGWQLRREDAPRVAHGSAGTLAAVMAPVEP